MRGKESGSKHTQATRQQHRLCLIFIFSLSFFSLLQKSAYTATGHDLHSLLFSFLDELLFGFATESFACAALAVTCLVRGGGEAKTPWTLTAVGKGEAFDRERHAAGTEVKAITYSAMRVDEEEGRAAEVWVIVDI